MRGDVNPRVHELRHQRHLVRPMLARLRRHLGPLVPAEDGTDRSKQRDFANLVDQRLVSIRCVCHARHWSGGCGFVQRLNWQRWRERFDKPGSEPAAAAERRPGCFRIAEMREDSSLRSGSALRSLSLSALRTRLVETGRDSLQTGCKIQVSSRALEPFPRICWRTYGDCW